VCRLAGGSWVLARGSGDQARGQLKADGRIINVSREENFFHQKYGALQVSHPAAAGSF
jgi:hypothetical protein